MNIKIKLQELILISKNKKLFLLSALMLLALGNTIILIIRIMMSIYNISNNYLPKNPAYIILTIIVPIILWVLSTAFDYFNYWNRKIRFVYYIAANISVVFESQLLRVMIPLILPITLKIPISHEITIPMVVNLSRGIIILFSAGIMIGLGRIFGTPLEDEFNQEAIAQFKLLKHIDIRKHKEFLYDFNVVSNLKTGRPYTIKEKDRTLHGFADGTTGTGKTSSVTSTAICNDMEQKVHNENYQRKCCYEMLKNGKIEMTQYFKDYDFSIDNFKVVKTGDLEEEKNTSDTLNFLKYISKSIGLTCLAPNEAFADEVYSMASIRGLKVNRVDPILTSEGDCKENFIGFNPFYVSPTITGINRDVDITNKAIIFSDVLQSLYEASGAGDPYFISLNQSVTINISKLIMLTFELIEHRPPHPGDFQNCVNNFSKCEPYLKKLVELYGDNGKPMNETQSNLLEERVHYIIDSRQRNIDCGQWQDVYSIIQCDLLGPNKENMFDRSNGLRIQVNNFLNHPLIRRVLCSANTIDLDRALVQGEITIVNYALELGKSVSAAFGLFFILSFSKAVLRRPGTENTRILHPVYMEEFTFLMHPAVEEFFTMHRQYKVSHFIFFQTLDQMEKNENTKFLKGILLGNCAHQIVFGRVSPTEMKIYEAMAGKVMKPLVQESVSETSITSENPSYSYSSRTTAQLGNVLEGHTIRNKDFQEVTVFTVDNGSPVPPFPGKVHFLSPQKRHGNKLKTYNWEPLIPQHIKDMKKTIETPKNKFTFSPEVCVQHRNERLTARFTARGMSNVTNNSVTINKAPLNSNEELLSSLLKAEPVPSNIILPPKEKELPEDEVIVDDNLLTMIGDITNECKENIERDGFQPI